MTGTAREWRKGFQYYFCGTQFMDHDTNDITAIITCTLVPEHQRTNLTADLFGPYWPLQLEPFIYSIASQLSEDYSGGYWQFFTLSNGGFYMNPDSTGRFQVISLNGNEALMSADALGITACLYAFSHLSFGQGDFAETCAQHYHQLRDFIFAHAEASNILRIID
jgi:hypothetical protein